MQLTKYVDVLRRELGVAAEAGGDEARQLAERLIAPLESATRLVLLEALSDAAAEITSEMAPGSVDIRLRGREPEFVVALPPAEETFSTGDTEPGGPTGHLTPDLEEGKNALRTTLRLAESLKAEVDEAAAREGLSVNAWLVRAAASALESTMSDRPVRRGSPTGQRYTGWAR